LFLPILALAATAARADSAPAAGYVISGSTGAALWGLGNEPGTEAVVFAFTAAAPVKTPAAAATAGPVAPAETDAPAPRVVFSITQWALVNNDWVQRQWYGDWPLAPPALAIATDLTQGTLDTPLMGTLVEQSLHGTVVQRNVPGQLKVKWTGSSDLANTTSTYTYQTPAYTAALQGTGTGRMAAVSASVTVPALGGALAFSGVGSLANVASGLLSVTMQ
jgi:hypothetical protein